MDKPVARIVTPAKNDPPTGGTNLPSRGRSQVGENHINIDKETKLRANTAPEQRLEETPTGESSDLLLGTVKQDSVWFLRSSVEEGGMALGENLAMLKDKTPAKLFIGFSRAPR